MRKVHIQYSAFIILHSAFFLGVAAQGQAKARRTILRFPVDRSLGTVEYRIQGSPGNTSWNSLGEAQGIIRVPPKAHTRLSLSAAGATDLSPLRAFKRGYLQAIRAAGTPIKDADLEHLSTLFALMYLDLSRTAITDKGLSILAGSLAVRDLKLGGTRVSDAGMGSVAKIRGLEALELPVGISDKGLAGLSELQTLRVLVLKDNGRITDDGLKVLTVFKNLAELDLSNMGLGNAALAHIGKIASLRHLSLRGTKVTDAGMVHLKPLRRLYELKLTGTAVGDNSLEQLADMVTLETLLLGGTRITDSGLVHMGRMRSLLTLSLASTRVTDAGLAHLTKLFSLETLYLNDTQVTDAGVGYLAALTSLKKLVLRDTKISDAARARLKKTLPGCAIVPLKEEGGKPGG